MKLAIPGAIKRIIHHKSQPYARDLSGQDFLRPTADITGGLGVAKDKARIPPAEMIIPGAGGEPEKVAQPEAVESSFIDKAKAILKAEAGKADGQFRVLNDADASEEIARRISAKLTSSPDMQRDTPEYNTAVKEITDQVQAENNAKQENLDFIKGDLQTANQYGLIETDETIPNSKNLKLIQKVKKPINSRIISLLSQLGDEGKSLAEAMDKRRMTVVGEMPMDKNAFVIDYLNKHAEDKNPQGVKKSPMDLADEALAVFENTAIVVEGKRVEPKNEASPERLNIQEKTFQTAKDLLKVWDQNDNLVISKNKKELEIQDRRPVSERGRLGMLIATYEGTTLPEAKLFLSGEIHKLLRQQNIDPSISPELSQKVAELSKNDREYENIQADVLMRVASIARIDMPPGALRGDLLTDVLIAHSCTKGLVVNQKTQTYELPEEARKAVSEWMEKGLMNGNDERLIKQLIAQDVTERVLSNIYGFDLALLEDTKNGPAIIAKRVVDIAHEEWMPDNLINMTSEDRAVALEQKTITENILLNDIGVAWQRFEEKTNNKKKFMQALGMLAMIALPVGSPLLDIGLLDKKEQQQMEMT